MAKLWITCDCTCDMPEAFLEQNDVDLIYFHITTDHGCFRDMSEITSTNIVEYFEAGGQNTHTSSPSIPEYIEFFSHSLKKHENIIHITIGSKLSRSYECALEAAKNFDGKIHVFDSEHLSSGMGHLLIHAIKLIKAEKTVDEILNELNVLKKNVSTSFIAYNADYLYRNAKTSKFVKDICTLFNVHPVLYIKDGAMKVKSVRIGDFDKAVLRYARHELRKSSKTKQDLLFITYSTCPVRLLSKIRQQVQAYSSFQQVIETKASATITSNCGANTIGLLYVKE